MARTVRDTALMFSALARHDRRDPLCLPDDPRDWTAGLEYGVAGLRVALLRRPGFDAPVDWEGIAAVEQAAHLLLEAGAEVEEAEADLPDVREIFGRIWGAALSKVVAGIPESRRHMLDHGIVEVAEHAAGASALDYMEADAMRLAAANAMARFHARYDLVLCPTVPGPPPLADAPTVDPVQSLWTAWAPWTFAFNLTRGPAITVPMGFTQEGLPRSVQIAASQYRDDLVLRAARSLELAQPFAVADLG